MAIMAAKLIVGVIMILGVGALLDHWLRHCRCRKDKHKYEHEDYDIDDPRHGLDL